MDFKCNEMFWIRLWNILILYSVSSLAVPLNTTNIMPEGLPFPASSWYISPSLYNSFYNSEKISSSSTVSPRTSSPLKEITDFVTKDSFVTDSTTNIPITSTTTGLLAHPLHFSSPSYKWLVKEAVTRRDADFHVKVLPINKEVSIVVHRKQPKRLV